MNGKPEKAVRLVDRKAEKVRAVNRTVNRKFAKPQASEWSFIPPLYIEFARLCGKIMFIPAVLFMALLEGVRAGFTRALEKALQLYRP